MSSSLRRLALDHASLRQYDLPPNYLFPSSEDSAILPDDLTQLTVLLTGAQGTPYAQGLWQLHLRIPADYPKNPPKATFKTRMWHPNVEESTGAVCLETLKRDWDPKLTLRDILLTISCLLIHPNPDSALNSAAGSLLQDDYEAFAEQARLMTSIHARIPASLRQAVDAARRRGDDTQFAASAAKQAHPAEPRSMSRLGATLLQKRLAPQHSRPSPLPLSRNSVSSDNEELSEDEEEDHDPSKENDPSQSPSLVVQSPRSPRKNVLGKRPLSELPTPTDPDEGMTASEKNIPINQSSHNDTILPSTSMKKSRLAARGGDVHVYNRLSETRDGCSSTKNGLADTDDEKENGERSVGKHLPDQVKIPVRPATVRPTLRKVSNVVSSKAKSQPRVGIRRL